MALKFNIEALFKVSAQPLPKELISMSQIGPLREIYVL